MSSSVLQAISKVSGTGVTVRGNDIDTDRIIPARFMKVITFDGLEKFAFEDARAEAKRQGQVHPFGQPAHKGASILVVNKNFGCGSSREHAPQALMRWGIKAIVGESFAEIFFGNCVSLGVPCLTLPQDQVLYLMELIESSPASSIEVDVEHSQVIIPSRNVAYPASLPAGARNQFLAGTWDALAVLMAAADDIDATAKRLPYVSGFAG